MKEFIVGLFTTASDRLKNPFLSSFLFSWIVINWKPVFVVLFSKLSIEARITAVSNLYGGVWHLLLFPLVCAVFYVLGLPYIMLAIDRLSKHSREGRKEVKYLELKKDLESKEIILKLEYKNEETRAGKRTLQEQFQANEKLTKELATKNHKISELVNTARASDIEVARLSKLLSIHQRIIEKNNEQYSLENEIDKLYDDESFQIAYDVLSSGDTMNPFILISKNLPFKLDSFKTEDLDKVDLYVELKVVKCSDGILDLTRLGHKVINKLNKDFSDKVIRA